MLASFAVYGRINYFAGNKERFNNELKKQLMLLPSTFMNANFCLSGFEFCASIEAMGSRLRYNGPWTLIKKVYTGLEFEVELQHLKDLNEAMYRLKNKDGVLIPFKIIIRIIWKSLIAFTAKKIISGEQPDRATLLQISNRTEYMFANVDNFVFKNSTEFVNFLFTFKNMEQKSFQRILDLVRGYVSVSEILVFKSMLARYIEKKLWEGSFIFFYPIQANHFVALLALAGSDNVTYSKLPNSEKAKLNNLYKSSWEKIWGAGAPDPTKYLLKVEQIGWEQNVSVANVFAHMFLDYVKLTVNEQCPDET